MPYSRRATTEEKAIYEKIEAWMNKWLTLDEEMEFFDLVMNYAMGEIDEDTWELKYYASRAGVTVEELLTWYYIDED